MNGERREEQTWCYFHPSDLVVGVCASCLKERLLVLASTRKPYIQQTHKPRNYKVFPKIFALSSFINPLDIKHKKFEVYCDDICSSTSQEEEDSFISIKFEDNGVASWDRGIMSKITNDHGTLDSKIKNVVVETPKPRTALRWRKRIGHLIQVSRWKRSSTSKANNSKCHGEPKLEGSKVKHGWMRILTKRRT